jgi:hypothetical protein
MSDFGMSPIETDKMLLDEFFLSIDMIKEHNAKLKQKRQNK